MNKKPSFSIIFLFALILCACSTSSPVKPEVTVTAIAVPTLTKFPTVTPAPTLTAAPTPTPPLADPSPRGDYLVYTIDGRLMFYDPATNTHTPLLPDWENIDGIAISVKNRLVFSWSHEGNREIYILDYPFTDRAPVNITRSTSNEAHPFSWSLDGRYLAYESAQGDDKTLMIWDGRTTIPIHHYAYRVGDLTWSLDGRLAFVESHADTSAYKTNRTEIFIWDGNTTTNLSENTPGKEDDPAWSPDGRLAFTSWGEEYAIFIWDGISKVNGVPDARTFVSVAPTWITYISYPVWTHAGALTFSTLGPEGHVQVFAWDGETVADISQNPGLHNGGQRWRSDGYWAFETFFSSQRLLYVRDEKNQTRLTTPGQYPSAWSPNGLLLFCAPEGSEGAKWDLSIWDGAKVVKIVRGYEILASWPNSDYVLCSNG